MRQKPGPKPSLHPSKNRNIRLTDHQWEVFRENLGPDWLRSEIAKVTPK